MSSSMLEQAVIDAQELKEAAIKNAEQEVLDKYSQEIKEAVDTLLEQEEETALAGAEESLGMEEGSGEDNEKVLDELSMKSLDGENKVSDLEEDEKIELNLDQLKEAIFSTENETTFDTSKEDLEMLLEDEEVKPDYLDLDKDGDEEESMKKASQEVEGEIELDEDVLKDAIGEVLKVDLKNVPRGMSGTTHPTETEQVYAVEVAAAVDEDTERKEQNEEFDEAVKQIQNLKEQVKSLKSEKNRLVKEHNELKSIARQVSDKLTELNVANAKLIYQNRILESHSLNERQKQKLVEAVSNANSTEEAKVIYETLQDSLASKGDNSPKNLSEAISKNNRLVLKSNKKETKVSNFAIERMKKLAGII